MGYFLADKTITLHDLANNGLLQLDQIRSYNTLSVFSNHSTDDDNDQKKENEEYFLDEIGASSRRSINKVNDHYSIPKRLTDTSISQKQPPSVQSAHLIKISSENRPRKSSISNETHHELKDNKVTVTRQRRRQTLGDSTLPSSTSSSRSSNQTPMKKNTKCKNI